MIDVLDFKAEGGNLFWNRKLHLFSKQMKVVLEMCLEKCFGTGNVSLSLEKNDRPGDDGTLRSV